jgi:hypothetical protein
MLFRQLVKEKLWWYSKGKHEPGWETPQKKRCEKEKS